MKGCQTGTREKNEYGADRDCQIQFLSAICIRREVRGQNAMMIEEFEQRTGFFPTLAHYKIIEQYYINFEGDKDTFCEAYKQNTEGIAERIQREANIEMVKAEQGNMEESARKDSVIDGLERKLKSVNEELEKEQEWQHYELPENVSQAD